MKLIFAAVLIAFCIWIPEVSAQTTLSLKGKGWTNSLDPATTLGSAKLTLGGTTNQICGIRGQLQSSNSDGSLTFQHLLVCADHSLFVLQTHTVIQVQSICVDGSIVGTFAETSQIIGMDGPFEGAFGEANITGSINCGFNDMKITGTLTVP